MVDFIGVGGQRCGTTFLFEYLRKHPDIFIPKEKELGFFTKIEPNNSDKDINWYYEKFKQGKNKVCGEITPEYLVDELSANKIYDLLGDVKIIILVRNPADRLISHYLKLKRDNEWRGEIRKFIEDNIDYCFDRSKYHEAIKRYLDIFTNVKILVYERDLKPDRMVNVFKFIGVREMAFSNDKIFNPSLSNNFINNRLIYLKDLLYRSDFLKDRLREIQRHKIINRAIYKIVRQANYRDEYSGLRAELFERFEDDIVKTSKLLNQDLYTLWRS